MIYWRHELGCSDIYFLGTHEVIPENHLDHMMKMNLDSLKFLDVSKDGTLDESALAVPLGYTGGLVIYYDAGVKIGSINGELICLTLGVDDEYTLRLDGGIDLSIFKIFW